MRELLLGLDGGGSKTLALLTDAAGHVVGRGMAGASNYQNIGEIAAWAALDPAIAAAFADAASQPSAVAAVGLGLAGVDRPEDRALFEGWAAKRFGGAPVVIANDAELVLAAGTPDGWGIALISGTGSIVFGRSPQGEMARAGGWGHIMSDEGSGYAIGVEALRAVMAPFDGRGPATALTDAVLAHWSLKTPPDLVGRVVSRSPTAPPRSRRWRRWWMARRGMAMSSRSKSCVRLAGRSRPRFRPLHGAWRCRCRRRARWLAA